MHSDLSLGGPVWFFATTVILLTVVMALFVVVDSLRPGRRAGVAARAEAAGRRPEALWMYAAGEVVFLLSLVAAQLLEGVTLVSAVPVALAPFALAGGVAYLLRVVYPRG